MVVKEDGSTLLALLVETSTSYWSSVSTEEADADRIGSGQLDLQGFLEQLLVFVNTFLLLSEDNQLVIFSVHGNSCNILYETPDVAAMGGSADLPKASAASVGRSGAGAQIVERIRTLTQQAEGSMEGPALQPALSGALSRALCYLKGRSNSGWGTSSARGLSSRILCLQGSPDVQSQYIACMNSIFSAQKAGIPIDTCMLGRSDSAFLQQAMHLTKGVYFRPPRPSALLQYLLTVFTADSYSRSLLQLPKPLGVDFRASCFCHKKAIDLGYVCSVCLSIFCKGMPECTTCGSSFGTTSGKLSASTSTPAQRALREATLPS